MVKRPQRWSGKQKTQVVLELLKGANAAELARECGISQAQLFAWRDQFVKAGCDGLKTRRRCKDNHAKQVNALERKVGQLTMEKEILKKSIHRAGRE